jgi:hypothetical protein
MKAPTPTAKFDKLRKLPTVSFYLHLIPYEINCGRHSGFPDCCIKFYVTQWIWHDIDSKFRSDYFKRLDKVNAPGYIPCPKCLKTQNFIEVKRCPKSCRFKTLLWGKDWWKLRKHGVAKNA